ncbi:MAG: hypothetical protein BGO34_11500 [Bacteroidia bacterium 44-10]|nr:MAG: hypothetical protein BGO34_11500 [Bacteroidia bacterium 44-10]
MRQLLLSLFLLIITPSGAQQSFSDWKQLVSPDTAGTWIQPVQGKPAMPVWGHADGIIVGLAPLPGPRGLIRIYTPYLDYEFPEVMNFIAFEPIPRGAEERGYSELEKSSLDKEKWGKRFWSSDDAMAVLPLNEQYPARGVVEKVNGEETLTLYVFSEPFDNGAKVYARLRFFESRPYELEITTNIYDDSIELDYFITTATMGNKARLRTLFLKEGQTSSLELWPDYKDIHFTPREYFSQKELMRDKKGNACFIAAPDEKDYIRTAYAPGTAPHWKYNGKYATQYWIKENPHKGLKGVITGRFTYWASKAPIPGGISIENFELNSPFKNGEKFIFGITPLSAEKFIEEINK